MKNFHGYGKRNSYFEGWYFKHTKGQHTVAIIPAYHIDKGGRASASIQIITQNKSYWIAYKSREFKAMIRQLRISIGSNIFDEKGMSVDIATKDLRMSGYLSYGPLTPIKGDIMGPFAPLPMQCHHGVVSMAHSLSGSLTINGEVIDFNGGVGYIEKDWGTSFPKDYLWTQGSIGGTYVMISAAHIPFLGTSFQGCICAVVHKGKEYRIATYRGAKIVKQSEKEIVLKQGKWKISAQLLRSVPMPLNAPSFGGMNRTIHESAASTVRYVLQQGDRVLFDVTSDTAGFEIG